MPRKYLQHLLIETGQPIKSYRPHAMPHKQKQQQTTNKCSKFMQQQKNKKKGGKKVAVKVKRWRIFAWMMNAIADDEYSFLHNQKENMKSEEKTNQSKDKIVVKFSKQPQTTNSIRQ